MTVHVLISPTHRAMRKYYEHLYALRNQNVENEMNIRSTFEFLLAGTAKLRGWTRVAELPENSGGSKVTIGQIYEHFETDAIGPLYRAI